ncbi:hypothetical protein ACR92I_24540 [Klebsiella pneumoniae]
MTDITELTQEAARESGSILIIVAARMARREFFTPLHALCEAGKRVVSTRALHDAVERAEERMVSQVPKIVDGHDRLTKKLKEAESRNAELVEALEKSEKTSEARLEAIDITHKRAARERDRANAAEEALEKAQRYIEELREWNAGLAQESCERQQRISELLQGKVGSALLERENHHVEVVGKLTKVITELESEVEKWRQEAEAWEQVAEKQLATAIELESRTVKLPDLRQIVSGDRYVWSDGVYNYSQDVKVVLAAAGIKVEAE